MNCYTTHTANEVVPMTEEECVDLRRLLGPDVDSEDDEDNYHGLGLVYLEAYGRDPAGAYLYTQDESSCADALPEAFLKEFGRLIGKAGLPHLEIGFAHSADKPRPATHGGGACRIYPDGKLEYPSLKWNRDE